MTAPIVNTALVRGKASLHSCEQPSRTDRSPGSSPSWGWDRAVR